VSNVEDAIADVRAACQRVVTAEDAQIKTRDARDAAFAADWPQLHPLGFKLIAAQVGDSISASTLRSMARELKPRPPRGPRFSPSISAEQQAALRRLREACVAWAAAEQEYNDALNARYYAIRAAWPVLAALGPAKIARSVGDRLVGESTIRQATGDLRRA
jgi:hypothetical protein